MPDADDVVVATASLVAQKLCAARVERGLSQESVAERAGIGARAYQRLEANVPGSTSRRPSATCNPTLATLARLAIALDVPITWLVDPAPENRPVPT